ncbi:hypothetical protein MNV49_001131 [Pseudohyphozyma bogoriensis]|nr:hypothetical protein MNV49_001131 [Pseudohyphozyma bogoriensis]
MSISVLSGLHDSPSPSPSSPRPAPLFVNNSTPTRTPAPPLARPAKRPRPETPPPAPKPHDSCFYPPGFLLQALEQSRPKWGRTVTGVEQSTTASRSQSEDASVDSEQFDETESPTRAWREWHEAPVTVPKSELIAVRRILINRDNDKYGLRIHNIYFLVSRLAQLPSTDDAHFDIEPFMRASFLALDFSQQSEATLMHLDSVGNGTGVSMRGLQRFVKLAELDGNLVKATPPVEVASQVSTMAAEIRPTPTPFISSAGLADNLTKDFLVKNIKHHDPDFVTWKKSRGDLVESLEWILEKRQDDIACVRILGTLDDLACIAF